MMYMNSLFTVTALRNANVLCFDKRAVFFDVKRLIRIVTAVAERVNFVVYVCSAGKAFR